MDHALGRASVAHCRSNARFEVVAWGKCRSYDDWPLPEVDGKITRISDTALMVAACRAHESELEDAFIHDPFAARLAGERGIAILRALLHSNVLRLGLAIRTRFVHELLLDALATHPIATVLSVGCGLDTRPWRLDLSPDLRWIEIDFADVLDYKDRLMSGERARCCRERLTVDLNDAAQRRAIYEAAGSSSALMITEGLLLYLPAATVDALAAEVSTHLNEVDRMLERAIASTRFKQYTAIQYARFADDLVILVDSHSRHDWLVEVVTKRVREELGKLRVEVNEENSRIVDLRKGESFSFLGFEFRRVRSFTGRWRPQYTPKLKKRTALLAKLREVFRRKASQPVSKVIELINPILRGWVNYFAVGHPSRCFAFIEDWVEKKIRRHMMRARKRKGFGWKRWSTEWLYQTLGLFHGYRTRYYEPSPKVALAR